MKSRSVVGKQIESIRQSRHYDDARQRTVVSIDAIVLSDGTELRPIAYDDGIDYYVDMIVVPPGDKPTVV